METESPDRLWHRTWLVTWQQECFEPLPHSHERWEPGWLFLVGALMVGYCSTGACDRNWLNRGALGLRRPFIWRQGDSAKRRVCCCVCPFPGGSSVICCFITHGTQRADTCDEAQWVIYKFMPLILCTPMFVLMGCECRNRKWRWLTATRLVHYRLTFKHKRVYFLYVNRKRENLLWLILLVIGWQMKLISWVFKTCHLGNEQFFSLYSPADNKFRNIEITEQTQPNTRSVMVLKV